MCLRSGEFPSKGSGSVSPDTPPSPFYERLGFCSSSSSSSSSIRSLRVETAAAEAIWNRKKVLLSLSLFRGIGRATQKRSPIFFRQCFWSLFSRHGGGGFWGHAKFFGQDSGFSFLFAVRGGWRIFVEDLTTKNERNACPFLGWLAFAQQRSRKQNTTLQVSWLLFLGGG